MPPNVFERDVTAISVAPITELASGNSIYQVIFGNYIEATPEIIDRLPPQAKQGLAKQIPITELTFFIKGAEIPYRIGSKWKLSIKEDGTLSLVELK